MKHVTALLNPPGMDNVRLLMDKAIAGWAVASMPNIARADARPKLMTLSLLLGLSDVASCHVAVHGHMFDHALFHLCNTLYGAVHAAEIFRSACRTWSYLGWGLERCGLFMIATAAADGYLLQVQSLHRFATNIAQKKIWCASAVQAGLLGLSCGVNAYML